MLFDFLFKKKRNRDVDKFDINEEEMNLILKKGAILVDVRSKQEYDEGHMEGAILLSEYDIKNKANMLLPNKNMNIIVYCSSGTRSKKAKEELQNMGYKNVYNLYNGFQNYWGFVSFMVKFFYTDYKMEVVWNRRI